LIDETKGSSMYRYMLCALQRFNTFFCAVQHTVPSIEAHRDTRTPRRE
jgi:hypothetical protein